MKAPPSLLENLRSAVGLMEFDRSHPLWRDIEAIGQPAQGFRIAVFGPFNYGKSTLLNALLGERTLPIDLIPTTGAAIRVCYGSELQTRICLADGTEQVAAGTDILKQFAILDDDRRMREDVTAVEVRCPHPWLQTGVELLDLPGTNDREAQDALVKAQLLTADLVVQVLDGRKLMTLGERENLRDWLLDRGITTVVFVVNFLNLLEVEDQKQVANRLRFVAESFRADLPPGISNLYRVDALPALRARLKGDMASAQATGLPTFESALQTIVAHHQTHATHRLPRIQAIAQTVKQHLEVKIAMVETALTQAQSTLHQRQEIKQKAQRLINEGFTTSLNDFSAWLSVENLMTAYEPLVMEALQQGNFPAWQGGAFKQAALDHQQAVVKWIHQACEFFEQPKPGELLISFPEPPAVECTEAPVNPPAAKPDDAPVAVATGIGWVLGGPMGAAVLGGTSYILNKALKTNKGNLEMPDRAVDRSLYQAAARHYLTHFSTLNLSALQRYAAAAQTVLDVEIVLEHLPVTPQHHQLSLLQVTLENLMGAIDPSP
jgi:Dynamin family